MSRHETAPDTTNLPTDALRLETEATMLLAESIRILGKGDHPFHSARQLYRKEGADRDINALPDVAVPPAPAVPLTRVWKLARRARLTSIEMSVLRLAIEGTTTAGIADLLAIPRQRARRLLVSLAHRMREAASPEDVTSGEQIACALYEDQSRRGYSPEQHCRRGHELCRRTRVCPKRRLQPPGDDG